MNSFYFYSPEYGYSSSFRIIIDDGNYYIVTLNFHQSIKVSLHKDGNAHYKFTSPFWGKLNKPNKLSYVMKWNWKDESQIQEVLRLLLYTTEFRQRNSMEDNTRLIPVDNNQAVEVLFFRVKNLKPGSWPGKRSMNSQLIDKIEIDDESTLVIVYSLREISEHELVKLSKYKNQLINKIRQINPTFSGNFIAHLHESTQNAIQLTEVSVKV